jgi:anti-sigma factor ChrR (cupin superfamily)
MNGPFTCREVTSLLTDYREQVIPWNVRILTGLHLRLCAGCHELLADLEALPAILHRFETSEEFLPIGQAALANAMGRLHEARNPRRLPETSVPAALQSQLAASADLPLRLLAQAHAAMMRGAVPGSAPFLPEGVLAQLPPFGDWRWRRSPKGVRRALLCAENGGPTLSVVYMPPRFKSSRHVHRGSESILVLEGALEQADRCLTSGDWIHLEDGSSHAPCAFASGCWCLVRDEGTIHSGGPRDWFRSLRKGA